MLRFGLLGPMSITFQGTAVKVVGDRRRVLLAVLLLDAGTPVSTDRLIDVLWSGAAPRLAKQALHNQVKRLRDVLGDQVGRRLATGADGYVFEAADDELDTRQFALLEATGREAADAGDWEAAADAWDRALALWRAEPLCDVPERPVFTDAAERWRTRRLQVMRLRLDALRRLGRHTELPGPLTELIREHPLDEDLRGQLMLALFRGNRQAEALAVFDETRRILVDELGIEPGPQLRRLHSRILRSDHTLALPRAPEPAAAPHRPVPDGHQVPRQLPAAVRHFVGRTEQLALLGALAGARHGDQSAAAVVTIDGTAGVGKTALAVHWGHQAVDRFPDGQLYANLRGFDPSGPASAPADVLHHFLSALGVAAQRIPAALEEKAALYRSATAGRRMLVLLDNAHDADQVRPLLPGAADCLVLVTSRFRLAGLVASDGAAPLTLDRLTADEAADLIARRLGAHRAREREAVTALAELCARLPLALNILAARALTEPDRPIAEYAAELTTANAGGRLDTLNAGDATTDVRAVLSWSYRQLDTAAARLFRQLGAHPGPDLSVAAAASLAGVDHATVRGLLDRLVHAHLLTRLPGRRFTFHDLLRAYAMDLSQTDEAESRAATLRVQDHYLHTARQAALLMRPGRSAPPVAEPQPGVTPEKLADAQQSRAWFDAEDAVLVGLIGQAARLGLDVHTWQLAWSVAEHWDRSGRFAEIVDTQRTALAAADRLGDRVAQEKAHGAIGRALLQIDDLEGGFEHLSLSLEAQRELGDEPAQALTHTAIASLHARRAEHTEVLRHGELALKLFRRVGDRTGEGIALNVVGWSHARLGAYDMARVYCRDAVELCRALADPTAEAAALDSLGEVEHRLGLYEVAAGHYREAVDLRLELGLYQHAANSLTRLGECRIEAGDPDGARKAWAEALAILEGLDHPDAAPLRTRLRESYETMS